MSEKTRKIILFGGLLTAVIWGYYNTIGQKSNPAPPATQTTQVAPVNKQSAPPVQVDTKEVEKNAWSTDPFNRSSAAVVSNASGSATTKNRGATQFVLKAIIYNETTRSAYLNGSVVREGDEVDGAIVESIERKKVVLRKDGESFAVTINRG